MANENIKVGADMTSFDQSMEQSAKKAEQSFYDIVNSVKKSSANVKKELRDITGAMTSMLAQGISPASAEYQRLAERAGALRDAISDVSEEINAQANDTRNMTLAFGAVGDALNVFQAGQATLSLFGVESEDAAEAIQKMMAAQQVLNSIQAIGNSLTSKSTLLGKAYATVKGMVTAGAGAQATAEGVAAVATTGLATAEGTATVATGALAIALNALPFVGIATAIGAAAVGLVELAKHIVNNTDEMKNAKAVMEAFEDVNNKAKQSYYEASIEIDKYRIMIENFVGSKKDEKKMVDELNNKYGDALGTYKTLSEWKGTLITQGQAYCEMLEEEAKAQALAAKMGELYAQSVSGEIDAKSYSAQVLKLRKAWEDTLVTIGAYKNLLRKPDTPAEPVKPKGNRPSGSKGSTGPRSITDTLHTMEQVDKMIADLTRKMNAETDLAKKLDLSNQLKQVQSFKDNIREISAITAPGNVKTSDLAGLGLPEPADLSKQLAELSAVLDSFNAKQTQQLLELQNAVSSFKENLSGDIGSVVDDFSMLARMLSDGSMSATDAAAGLVVMGNALKQLGSDGPIAKAGAVLAAIGQIILGFAQASAQAASLGPWGWLAFVGAGLASVAATISTIQGFNRGGIVRGAGSGDTVPAMLTPGEAVLTRNDQSRLWRMLKTGGSMGGAMPEVRLRIQGGDLVGVMGNYGTMTGKI